MERTHNNIETKLTLKERIIEKSTQLFTTRGIKCITMDEIASSLGISKRTLYEIFSDKEGLLKECILNIQKERNEFINEIASRSDNVLEVILMVIQQSIEIFHTTSKQFFEDMKKYPKIVQIMKDFRDRDSTGTIAFFKNGVDQGLFRDDVNFSIVNLLVNEQFDLLLNTNVCDDYPFIEVYESIMFTFLRGISTPKGALVLEDFIQNYRKSQKK